MADTRKKRIVAFGATAILLLILGLYVSYRPRVLIFHARISSAHNRAEVFRSADAAFFVQFDSGSQLTVRQNPPKVFLSNSTRKRGTLFGKYLVLPASALGGIDLSQNEGFNRQTPIITNGV